MSQRDPWSCQQGWALPLHVLRGHNDLVPPGLCHVTGGTRGDVPTLELGLLENGWNVGAQGIILPWKEDKGWQPWCLSLVFRRTSREHLEKGRMQGDLKNFPGPKGVPRELEMDLGQGTEGQDKGE